MDAIEKIEFVDAQEMHRDNPDTFEVPSNEELNTIKSESIVKVCYNSERFWVEVVEVNGDVIIGTVDNDFLGDGLSLGDTIKFDKKHVYDIWS